MLNCEEVIIVISIWEKTGKMSIFNLSGLENHFSKCSQCKNKYSSLLDLIKRDTYVSEGLDEVSLPPYSPFLTDSIMRKIELSHKPLKKTTQIRKDLIAVAAVVIVFLGLNICFLLYKQPSEYETQTIKFSITAPNARSVTIVGDFTNWKHDLVVLTDTNNDGIWETEVSLQKDNLYKYNYLIDGEIWITDPDSELIIEDGFGGKNSFIQL